MDSLPPGPSQKRPIPSSLGQKGLWPGFPAETEPDGRSVLAGTDGSVVFRDLATTDLCEPRSSRGWVTIDSAMFEGMNTHVQKVNYTVFRGVLYMPCPKTTHNMARTMGNPCHGLNVQYCDSADNVPRPRWNHDSLTNMGNLLIRRSSFSFSTSASSA